MATGKKIRAEESIRKQTKSYNENKEKNIRSKEELVNQIKEESKEKLLPALKEKKKRKNYREKK